MCKKYICTHISILNPSCLMETNTTFGSLVIGDRRMQRKAQHMCDYSHLHFISPNNLNPSFSSLSNDKFSSLQCKFLVRTKSDRPNPVPSMCVLDKYSEYSLNLKISFFFSERNFHVLEHI